jgi:hypothetical protein
LWQLFDAACDPSPQQETHLCVAAIAINVCHQHAYLLTVGEPQLCDEATAKQKEC